VEVRDKAAGQGDAFAPVPAGDPAMRQLYNGAGDGLHRAMEMAIVPALFGAFGYGLDRWLGLLPVLTIAFVVLAVIGLGARMFYVYDARMRQHEAESPWAPSGPA